MSKRILWLLNHTTLRNFEVPMLIRMGYEVFTPKIYQFEYGDLSASVTDRYDETLTIPKEALDLLNSTDFYCEHISEQTADIINRYFDIAIFGAFWPQIKMLVRVFDGIMLFQAFGLEKTMTYTKLFKLEDPTLMDEIRRCGSRFWFGASYKMLPEVEDAFFQRQSLYLPIGLNKDSVKPIWKGGDERILFIGPKIMTNVYYKDVYEKFKKDFGDLPHVIGGAQMIPVSDPTVLGFVPQELYEYNMVHLAAMYYHSQEPRHLHYHPLEAVANGMPLIFMAGGMLDSLGGKNLPGRCQTVREAHRKLQRLSQGDLAFAKEIVEPQGVLLDTFQREFCEQKWHAGFEKIERVPIESKATKRSAKRIALIIPQAYTGGVLDFTIRMAMAIKEGARHAKDDIDVVIYYRKDPVYETRDYFLAAKQYGIGIRSYEWTFKKQSWFQNLQNLLGETSEGMPREGYVIEDGAAELKECDCIIFTSDLLPSPYYSRRRYALVVHDVIQQYLPGMLDEKYEADRMWHTRRAERVFVTSPHVKEAVIQHIGLPREHVVALPQLFDPIQTIDRNETEREIVIPQMFDRDIFGKRIPREIKPYFLWSTNLSAHKNHLKALEALNRYYARGGTLECVITGSNTEYMEPETKRNMANRSDQNYIRAIWQCIQERPFLEGKLRFCGELEKEAYQYLLGKAAFVFHPGYADNGNGVSFEAAQLGVPTLTADYPGMRYMDQRMQLHCTYFDPHDADSICSGLLNMERCAAQIALIMQQQNDHYEQFTWPKQCDEVYARIKSVMRGCL